MKLKSFRTNAALTLTTLMLMVAAAPTAATAQTFATVHSFGTGGEHPLAGLVQATNGDFYGTTVYGGANWACHDGCGTVFKITPSGALTRLYSFCSQSGCTDGVYPFAALVQATNGNLYGTTSYDGANHWGTVFKITPSGTLTTLHSFDSTDGAVPFAALVLATNGNLYGTTYYGGANGYGTVFKITPSGTLTTLYSFCPQSGCADGESPSTLIQGTDGNLYGTTYYTGANGQGGTVFKITPSGTLTTLYSFCSQSGCADGGGPSTLIQGTDNNLYGTAYYGGQGGTVFKITPSGTLTTLYSFCSQSGCTDGRYPNAGLAQATDGNFYGTTVYGGANGWGTVFKIAPSGTLTTLYSFCSQSGCADGGYPYAALVQATNGNLYGTTSYGGTHDACDGGCGTVFSLSVGLGPFVSLASTSGKAGKPIEVLGQGFTGTTAVSFNSTPATYTVVSDTFLTATVPNGATTGSVTVTTPSGTLTSNKEFRVTP